MNKKSVVPFLIVLALAGFAVILIVFNSATGFIRVNKVYNKQNNSLRLIANKDYAPLKITVIGDSLARGTGDEDGQGFSTYVIDYLKSYGVGEVSVNNSGINGLQSTQLLEELKSGKLAPVIADSQILVLSIGGNDLLSLHNLNEVANISLFKNILDKYQSNLKETLEIIHSTNPDTVVYFIGLYKPREDDNSLLYDSILNIWNNGTRKLVEADGRGLFISTNDIFKDNLQEYISSDGLHPNAAGYRAISSIIAGAVKGLWSD